MLLCCREGLIAVFLSLPHGFPSVPPVYPGGWASLGVHSLYLKSNNYNQAECWRTDWDGRAAMKSRIPLTSTVTLDFHQICLFFPCALLPDVVTRDTSPVPWRISRTRSPDAQAARAHLKNWCWCSGAEHAVPPANSGFVPLKKHVKDDTDTDWLDVWKLNYLKCDKNRQQRL